MMKKWLPRPATTIALLLAWLLLNQSADAATLLQGLLFGILIPVFLQPLQPLPSARVKRPAVILRLLAGSSVEIVRSTLNVARIILRRDRRGIHSQFIRIPLDLRNPYGLAVLSCLINSTPGTVWTELTHDTHELVLHVLDLNDEQWWIRTIKTQYEQPLIEIFE